MPQNNIRSFSNTYFLFTLKSRSFIARELYKRIKITMKARFSCYKFVQLKHFATYLSLLLFLIDFESKEIYSVASVISLLAIIFAASLILKTTTRRLDDLISMIALLGILFMSSSRSTSETATSGFLILSVASSSIALTLLWPPAVFRQPTLAMRLLISSPFLLLAGAGASGFAIRAEIDLLIKAIAQQAAPLLSHPELSDLNPLLPAVFLIAITSVLLIAIIDFRQSPAVKLLKLPAMRQHLHEAITAHREAASMLAHEFCAPLASISATCQLIEHRKECSKVQVYQEVGKIRKITERLALLTESWLADECAGFGVSNKPKIPVNLHELLCDLSDEYGATLITNAKTDVKVMAHNAPLIMALSNLIENARKHSGKDGNVEVRYHASLAPKTSGKKLSVVIEVKDNGPGIAIGEEKAIFEKNYRSRKSLSHDGMGMGLFTSKCGIKAHNGNVEAYNNKNEPGCTFKVEMILELATP